MVTQKDKFKDKILALRAKGLSVLKISEKLGINRGVTNSILYPYKAKGKTVAKKIVAKKTVKEVKKVIKEVIKEAKKTGKKAA